MIDKVRTECRAFLKSPQLNDELLKRADKAGCGLKLVIDVRTRWNSTVRMLRNFAALEAPLRTLYADGCRQGQFPLSKAEVASLKEVVVALEHVERAIKRLSKEETTLRSADLAIQVRFY